MFSFLHITEERQPHLVLSLPSTWLQHTEIAEVAKVTAVTEVTEVSLATPAPVVPSVQREHSGEDGQLGAPGEQEEAGLGWGQAEAGPGEEREEDF